MCGDIFIYYQMSPQEHWKDGVKVLILNKPSEDDSILSLLGALHIFHSNNNWKMQQVLQRRSRQSKVWRWLRAAAYSDISMNTRKMDSQPLEAH